MLKEQMSLGGPGHGVGDPDLGTLFPGAEVRSGFQAKAPLSGCCCTCTWRLERWTKGHGGPDEDGGHCRGLWPQITCPFPVAVGGWAGRAPAPRHHRTHPKVGVREEWLPWLGPRRHLGGGVAWAVQAELRRRAQAGGQFGSRERLGDIYSLAKR